MKEEYIECDRCDGCGWYEGGKTLQTTCEICGGTGKIKTTIKKGKLGTEFYVLDQSIGGFTASFKDFNISAEGDFPKAHKNLWNVVYDILKSKTSNIKSLTKI
jgi:DnaJ-class molecular chaperone